MLPGTRYYVQYLEGSRNERGPKESVCSVAHLGLFFNGCASTEFFKDFNIISPEQEQQLGDELHQSITEQSTIITDPTVDNMSNPWTKSGGGLPLPNQNYQFHVIEDPSVNAFAIPVDILCRPIDPAADTEGTGGGDGA